MRIPARVCLVWPRLRSTLLLSAALPLLAPASALAGSESKALYERGQALLQQNDAKGAEAVLQRCITQEPSYAPCHMLMSAAKVSLGKMDEGIKAYQEFARLAPNDARAVQPGGMMGAQAVAPAPAPPPAPAPTPPAPARPAPREEVVSARSLHERGKLLVTHLRWREAEDTFQQCLMLDASYMPCQSELERVRALKKGQGTK